MTPHFSSLDPQADERITALLRSRYAAPRDDAYWLELERAILARARDGNVANVERSPSARWPAVLDWRGALPALRDWRAAGVAAAGIAAVATTLGLALASDAEARLAYEGVSDDASILSTSAQGPAAREATLLYLIGD